MTWNGQFQMSGCKSSRMFFLLVSQSKVGWVAFYQKERQCQQEEWPYLCKCGPAGKFQKIIWRCYTKQLKDKVVVGCLFFIVSEQSCLFIKERYVKRGCKSRTSSAPQNTPVSWNSYGVITCDKLFVSHMIYRIIQQNHTFFFIYCRVY